MNIQGIFTAEFMNSCFEKLIREHVELFTALEQIKMELYRAQDSYSYRILHPDEKEDWGHPLEFDQGYVNGLLCCKYILDKVKEAGENGE